jgi:hypothetical protein
VSVGLCAGALALGAGATASPPVHGAHYATRHAKVVLHVGPAGRRIFAYRFAGRFHCNKPPFRNGRYRWHVGPRARHKQPRIRIRHHGRFAVTVHARHRLRAPGTRVVRTLGAAYTLRGHFAPHRRARGTLRAVLVGRGGLRCVGRQRWVARVRR